MHSSYTLIDSGLGKKFERFGPYDIIRPSAQAVWLPQLPENKWQRAHAFFFREQENKWEMPTPLPTSWNIDVDGLLFKISPTDFGHLGIFPEQRPFWRWLQTIVKTALNKTHTTLNILNLFAYSGGSTLACAKAGASVCHLDASKGMVAWARENAAINNLENAPIRWIVDDVEKFLRRELARGRRYDGIILDPPTFGRGSQGEVFKIENSLHAILEKCRALLSEKPLFILFSCHTPGFTPIVNQHIISQMMHGFQGTIDSGEMTLTGDEGTLPLPSGSFARWVAHA